MGAILARAFQARGDEVVVLSRSPGLAPWRVAAWDGISIGPWTAELDGADVVINLAGRSVNCRYTPARRRELLESRVRSTRVIGDAIAAAKRPPRVWLQASTATIYAHRYDAPNDERTGRIGGDEVDAPDAWRFSIEVARAWEQAATESAATLTGTRLVLLRSAMVMSPDRGGVFDAFLRLVRWGLGGAQGDGRQFVSWIYDRDFVRAVGWIIDHEELVGPVNLASPGPLPNAEFLRLLRRAWGARLGLPTPRVLLELGAWLVRTESELLLKSRRVIPGRLLESGCTFEFPEWGAAAEELCRRWSTNGE